MIILPFEIPGNNYENAQREDESSLKNLHAIRDATTEMKSIGGSSLTVDDGKC